MGIKIKTILNNDVLFNSFNIKFPVEINRVKDKKETRFPIKWSLIQKNKCIGNEDNIAFKTGIDNNITVIDFDDQISIDWFENNIEKFCDTKAHRVKTTKGYHLYYQYSKELDMLIASFTKKKVAVIHKIDIRSVGNCIFYGKGYLLEHYEPNLSTVPVKFINELKEHFQKQQVKITSKQKNINPKPVLDMVHSNDDIVFILSNLSYKRCVNFDDWIKITICLKHSFGEKYKQEWIDWCKKSVEHIKYLDLNEVYWNGIKDGPLTISSVYAMLKEDNIVAFNQLYKRKKPLNELATQDILFGDYTMYMNGVQEISDIEFFFKATLRYIINKGNTCWAVKIKDENNDIRWNVVNNFPCNMDMFSYENDKEKILLDTFLSIANKIKSEITKQNVVFTPYSPSSNYDFDKDINLNLFAGWKIGYQKNFVVDKSVIEPILHHIKKVFCKDNELLFDYMINWQASIIQAPQIKTSVCPCFISDQQGAGKNMYWDWIGKEVFGTSYQYVSDIETIFAKFNKRFENSLLIACDEISSNGMAYKMNNQLKSIITQEKQSIEPKGMEAYQINDYRNYIMLSNNEHIVKVEASDRRYVFYECDNCYVGDFDYFKALKSNMDNINVKQTFFHYLIQRDLSDFIIKKIPNSSIRTRVMGLSVPNHFKFLEHYSSTIDDDITLKLSPTELYKYYQIFIKNFEANFGLQTSRKFGLEISKYLVKNKSHGVMKYTISRSIVINILKKYYKDDDFNIEFIGDLAVYNLEPETPLRVDPKNVVMDENQNVIVTINNKPYLI